MNDKNDNRKVSNDTVLQFTLPNFLCIFQPKEQPHNNFYYMYRLTKKD